MIKHTFLFPLVAVFSALAIYHAAPIVSIIHVADSEQGASNEASSTSGSGEAPAMILTEWKGLKTFRATSPDGALLTDDNNNLIIDRQLRFWIDFYLAALGEVPLVQIKQWMLNEMAKLPQPGQQQAIELLNNYLNYKSQLAEFDGSAGFLSADLQAMSDRLEWQQRLRREWLRPETVQAFWSMDEAIDGLVLDKLIIRNSNMSEQQKQHAIETLEQSMPEQWQQFRQQVLQASDLEAEVENMRRSAEYDEQDVRNYRLQSVGPEATTRLEALDQQQQQWKDRVTALINEEARIAAIEGIDSAAKKHLLMEYQTQNFSTQESLRLPAAKLLLLGSEQ